MSKPTLIWQSRWAGIFLKGNPQRLIHRKRLSAVTPIRLFLLIQHRLQIGKRIVGGLTDIFLRILTRYYRGAVLVCFGVLRVLVIVAVQAQQLPVAAVFRVIGMIVIDVVNRQLAQVGIDKLA